MARVDKERAEIIRSLSRGVEELLELLSELRAQGENFTARMAERRLEEEEEEGDRSGDES